MYNIIQTISLRTELFYLMISKQIQDRVYVSQSVKFAINQKRLVCENCLEMSHVKWSNHQLNQNASNKAYKWTCPNCIHIALPFYDRRNLDFDSTVADEATILHTNNCHVETLKNHQEYTSIAHINCQSILSTFDEFTVMLKSYEFDIISLSKTWLTNNQHRLDYVNITGYKSIFMAV